MPDGRPVWEPRAGGEWTTYDQAPPGCSVTVTGAGITYRAGAVLRVSEARWLGLRLAEAAALREMLGEWQPVPKADPEPAPAPVHRCNPCKIAVMAEKGAIRTAVRGRSLHDGCLRGTCECGCAPQAAKRCQNCGRYGLPMAEGACVDISACAAEMLHRGVDASRVADPP
jgi:hypothetical protein